MNTETCWHCGGSGTIQCDHDWLHLSEYRDVHDAHCHRLCFLCGMHKSCDEAASP